MLADNGRFGGVAMATGVVDGALIIDTKIDNSGLFRSAQEFNGAVKSMKNTVDQVGQDMARSGKAYVDAISGGARATRGAAASQAALEREITKTEAAIARLTEKQELQRRKWEASRDAAVEKAAEEFEKMNSGLEAMPWEDAEQAAQQFSEDMSQHINEVLEKFGEFEDSAAFRNVSAEIEFLNEKLAGLRAQLQTTSDEEQEQQQSGASAAAGFANIARSAGHAAMTLAKIAGSGVLNFLKKLAEGAKNAFVQLAKLTGRAIVTGLRAIGRLASSAAKGITQMGKSSKSSGIDMKAGLMMLLKYGFGIRSMFFLFRRLKATVKEGLGEIAKRDPQTQKSINNLIVSFNALKGALATAFQPIVTAVTPALVTFMNVLARAISMIGQFFAALTGQDYYMKSVGALTDTSNAAKSASGNVKELNRQLAGFDQLNILSDKNSGGSGSGASGASSSGMSYTRTPLDGGIKTFVENLKALFARGEYDKVGAVIAEGINGAFDKARAMIDWNRIGPTVTHYVDALAGTFNGLISSIDWPNIGRTFANGINTIAYTINHAFDTFDLAGLGQALADGLNGLVESTDFSAVGRTLANILTAKFVVVGNALARFDWEQFGPKLAEGFNSFIKRLNDVIGSIDWPGIARKMASGLNGFIRHIEWRELGDTLARRLKSMLDAAKEAITTFSWSGAAAGFAKALNAFFRRKDLWTAAGDTIKAALHGILDFAESFVVNFDEIAAANAIRAALGRIDWSNIASSFWNTAKNAFSKAGNFVKVLLGGDVYDVAGDAVDQMWERGSGKASSKSYSVSWVSTLATSIGKALASIPWEKLFDEVKKAAGEAIGGLVDGLFGTEDGVFLVKLVAALGALQLILPGKFSALGKIIVGAIQLLGTGIKAALEAMGLGIGDAALLAFDAVLVAYDISSIKKLVNEYQELQKSREDSQKATAENFARQYKENPEATLKGYELAGYKGLEGKTEEEARKRIEALQNLFQNGWSVEDANRLVDDIETANSQMTDDWKRVVAEINAKVTPKAQLQPYDERYPKTYTTYGEWKAQQEANTHAIEENTEAVERGQANTADLPSPYELAMQGYYRNSGLEEAGNVGLFGRVGDAFAKLFGGTENVMPKVTLKAFDEYKREQKRNTEALKENTSATEETKPAIVETAFGRDFREALMGGTSASVTVGVEYEPNVPGGAAYKNDGVIKWLQKLCAPGVDTQTRVELIREGWKSVAAWVETLTGGNVDKAVGLLRFGWDTLYSYVMGRTGGDVTKGVGITQDKWKTIADWIIGMFLGGGVTKGIGITQEGWKTVAGWIGTVALMGGVVKKGVGVKPDGFKTLAAWLSAAALMGGAVKKGVGIKKDGFNTVAAWLSAAALMGGAVLKGVGIKRDDWKTVAAWITASFMGGAVTKGVGVTQSRWSTIADWITAAALFGGAVTKGIGVTQSGWSTIADWASKYLGGNVAQFIELAKKGWDWVDSWTRPFAKTPVDQFINLAKNGWSWVNSWVSTWAQTPVNQFVDLAKKGWDWVDTWAKQFAQTPIQQQVELVKKPGNKVTWHYTVNGNNLEYQAAGGIITAGGAVRGFAQGGIVRNGAARWWNGIPHYAAGTSRAHGTMFVAGEAGPEIVGHINGRTEILNKSQLAQTMYSAVTSGMLAALRGIEFKIPAMATGSVMPYEVSAQITKSAADIQGTLDANNEDLIQTIISVIGQQTAAIVAALQRQGAAGGMSPQQVVDYINRRSMMGLQPLKGV